MEIGGAVRRLGGDRGGCQEMGGLSGEWKSIKLITWKAVHKEWQCDVDIVFYILSCFVRLAMILLLVVVQAMDS